MRPAMTEKTPNINESHGEISTSVVVQPVAAIVGLMKTLAVVSISTGPAP